MKKRILSILLAAIMVMSLLPLTGFAAELPAGEEPAEEILIEALPEQALPDEEIPEEELPTEEIPAEELPVKQALLGARPQEGSLQLLAAQEQIPYISYTYNAATGELTADADTTIGRNDVTELNGSMTTWSTGWYVADGSVTLDASVTVKGDVRLILMDNCTLTCTKGICVEDNNSEDNNNKLTIYAQSEGSSMGKLIATGENGNAGIGTAQRWYWTDSVKYCGDITIHGGDIWAVGGDDAGNSRYGAGIGGGNFTAGGTVTVYGGKVHGESFWGAGIGGGREGDGGTLNLYGGKVEAVTYNHLYFPESTSLGTHSAAIGGGYERAGTGTLNVYGGTVQADSGKANNTIGGTVNVAPFVELVNKNGQTLKRDSKHPKWTDVIKAESVYFTTRSCTGIRYLDSAYNADTKTVEFTDTPLLGFSEVVGSSVTAWTGGWYVLNDNCTVNAPITVSGDVKLLLMNDKTLTANKGIVVEGSNSLTIYGQAVDGGTPSGTLIAKGDTDCAGIGSSSGNTCGTVTVHSGNVQVTGGSSAAGIGGGKYSSGGTFTVYGGTVTATGGQNGAGIGSGMGKDNEDIRINGGKLTVYGGTVTAQSYVSGGGAGIGGGAYGNGGTVSVKGGTVTATAYGSGAAGIGSGAAVMIHPSNGGTVDISGGTVVAQGGKNSAGIGGGVFGNGGACTISGGEVEATGGRSTFDAGAGAGIGGGANGSGIRLTLSGGAVNAAGGDAGAKAIYADTVTKPIGCDLQKPDGSLYTRAADQTWSDALSDALSVQSVSFTVVTRDSAVPYLSYTYDKENSMLTLDTDTVCEAYTEVEPTTTKWTDGGWYVVNTDTNISDVITVSGSVHLILMDGTTLRANKGIRVNSGSRLTIYVQSTDPNTMGTLIAINDLEGCAGIGGSTGSASGVITIHGGNISATGGQFAAGIGGGGRSLSGSNVKGGSGTVTVYGGVVIGTGGTEGAGIGGGCNGAGIVTIYGGKVTGNGGTWAAGIGGGRYASCTFTLTGGTVDATSGSWGAGVGAGPHCVGSAGTFNISGGTLTAIGRGGAGIGGGAGSSDEHTTGGTVTISGGSVTAMGGEYSAGIGGGHYGAGLNITITGGSVTATGNTTNVGITGWRSIGAGEGGSSNGTVTVGSNTALIDRSGKTIERSFEFPTWQDVFANEHHVDFSAVTGSEEQRTVPYIAYRYDAASGECVCDTDLKLSGTEYKVVSRNETTWENGWYVVCTSGTYETPITVKGDVKLILMNGTTLRANKGIVVEGSNSLTIYGQAPDGAGEPGKLFAKGVVSCAGIGSRDSGSGGRSSGTVTVHGGYVEAIAGDMGAWAGTCAAGIGGGASISGGKFNMYGGEVYAEGSVYGAGIGGGYHGTGGTVNIYGGTVTAKSIGGSAAGIGAGYESGGCTVNIYGGTVTAESGGGAGIGGGYNGDGGTVNIYGGTVSASSHGRGIGAGYHHYNSSYSNGTINVSLEVMLLDSNNNVIQRDDAHPNWTDLLCGPSVYFVAQLRDRIPYLEGVFNEDATQVTYVQRDHVFHYIVDPNTTTWANDWYVLSDNCTFETPITVKGDVKLLLMDGKTLTAKNGIRVDSGSRLTVYAQSSENLSTMGALNVTGSPDYCAGIGGGYNRNSGEIIIHGGKVIVKGGSQAAAIGGGNSDGSSNGAGNVTIYGGYINATGGSQGAGIGGGMCGKGTVKIYGGSVTAYGGFFGGAGIGGGASGTCDVLIDLNSSGGVHAYGGNVIASDFFSSYGGAGIGNGGNAGGGRVVIESSGISISASGGMVTSDMPGKSKPGDAIKAAQVIVSPHENYMLEFKTAQYQETGTAYTAETQIQAGELAGKQELYIYMSKLEQSGGSTSMYHLVRFDLGGHGSWIDTQQVPIGGKAVKPTDPSEAGWRFVGWYADPQFSAEFNFDAEITGETTAYAKWMEQAEYSGDSSTVTVPVSGDANSVKISATVSGSTATVKEIKDADLAKVADSETIEIDLSGLNRNIDTAKLPTTTVEKIGEQAGMSVKLSTATVSFDAAAVGAISEAATGADIALNVKTVDKKELSAAQKSTVEGLGNAVIVKATLTSGGKTISDFGGGSAAVTVPYAKKDAKAVVVVYYLDDSGKLTKMNATYDAATKSITFVAPHFSEYVIAEVESSYATCLQDSTCPMAAFSDLDVSAWYHDGVHFCVENGYMQGVSTDKFAPSGTLSRAMIVTMLWRLEGKPVVNYAMSFKDVPADEWYTEAIRWAAAEGIVKGYEDGTYKPDKPIIREELATILYRYAQSKGEGFTGSWMFLLDFADRTDISSWADEAVHWCSMKGIVTGKDGKVFDPQGDATRAEAATMLQRFCEALEK